MILNPWAQGEAFTWRPRDSLSNNSTQLKTRFNSKWNFNYLNYLNSHHLKGINKLSLDLILNKLNRLNKLSQLKQWFFIIRSIKSSTWFYLFLNSLFFCFDLNNNFWDNKFWTSLFFHLFYSLFSCIFFYFIFFLRFNKNISNDFLMSNKMLSSTQSFVVISFWFGSVQIKSN